MTNFDDLKQKFLPEHENPVDSSIIPALLDKFSVKGLKKQTPKKEIKVITKTLELLKGTYGVWIVNSVSLNIYLARQGSTLFYDKNSFSSIKGTKFKEIKEGNLYGFSSKGVIKLATFKSNSPFLEI